MRIMTGLTITIVLSMTCATCQSNRQVMPPTRQTSMIDDAARETHNAKGLSDADYLDIAEAVFRHQFDHNASGAQRHVDYFFISIDGKDPSPDFLKRFASDTPHVLPKSDAQSSPDHGVNHRTLGGKGLIFRIEGITRVDADTVTVQGGYYEAGLSASGNSYRVERRSGKWTVTRDEMNWIS